MTKCSRCNVFVHDQHTNCPLCEKPLQEKKNSVTAYPIYENNNAKNNKKIDILLFLTVVIIISTITINILTFKTTPVTWSPIVILGLIYLWVLVKNTILSNNHIGKKIVLNYTILSLFLLVVDVCTGFIGWSTTYAIPLFGICATFLMTAIAIRNKSLWQNDMGYILAMFFINLIPLFLFIFHFSYVLWPSVAAIIYSLINIIGMLIFSKKRFKKEIQKRFHFK